MLIYTIVKFSWSHVSRSSHEGDLYMSFGAWPAEEREVWMSTSPGFRAKRCTVWESTIRSRYEATIFVLVAVN